MKTLGLIGGMSVESTAIYYRLINEGVRKQLGGLHSAPCLISSVDFAEIAALQSSQRWQEAGELLADHARRLQQAGAEAIVLCTNTMHKVAPQIKAAITIPFLHIADATGAAIRSQGLSRIALLATRFTMDEPFYREQLSRDYDLEILLPSDDDRAFVHGVIFEELCRGEINPSSKSRYLAIIDTLHEQGAQAVILGCTEIGLLVNQNDTTLPLFDSCALHAQSAVDFALGKTN